MKGFKLEPGTVLHSRYRIMRQIGVGGMGAVYEATDNRLHNTVAVKQMIAAGYVDAFEQEARFLAALRHAGLPVVIDYFTEDDNRYLVMQYIEGEDLAHVLKRARGSCDEDEVVAWGSAILDVLIYLHDHHPPIVHRDIKPANIKLTPRGDVVLLDFGLAKGRLESQTHVDDDRSVFGYTPNYAPIEQVEWRGTDPRSDLYALGATLFHLVTGVSPVSAQARAAALKGGHPDPLLPASNLNNKVTAALSDVLARALEMEPAKRFASAREMRAALADHPGARCAPRPPPETSGARRVDAAMPSQAQVGSQVDLIVQVRFADSPLLGLEDWPTKRRPEKIDQASEQIHVEYPTEPRTGKRLPARLRIKLVAPDFAVDGQAEHLIEVSPDEYSKRLAFLLTPRRAGFCRVNVEVYAIDTLYLGTIPVEAEAIAVAVANPVYRVANLVLGLLTRERDTTATLAMRRPVESPTAAVRASPPALESAPRRELEEAAIIVRTPLPLPDDRQPPAAAEVFPQRALAHRRGVPRWLYVVAPALLVTAIVVSQRQWATQPPIETVTTSTPAPMSPPTPAAPDPAPSAVPTPPPVATQPVPRPMPGPTRPPVAADPGPPPPAAPTGPPVPAAPSPVAPVAPPSPKAPSRDLKWPAVREVTSSNANVSLQLTAVTWTGQGRLRVHLVFVSREALPALLVVDNSRTHVSSGRGVVYPVANDGKGSGRNGTFQEQLRAFDSVEHWMEFAVPDNETGTFQLVLANPASDSRAARFPSLGFTLRAR